MEIIEQVRAACLKRGPAGIKQFSRMFRIYDDDRSNTLSVEEFKKGVADYGLRFSDEEFDTLFTYVDTDHTGTIRFDEFLIALRPPMCKSRITLVDKAFDILDTSGDGVITYQDISKIYCVKEHKKYKSGEYTSRQVLEEFLSTFDIGGVKDNKVTREEFRNYYASVSASIDKDIYFDLMMRQSWKL